MVMEGDWTSDGEHTTQYTNDASQNDTLETHNLINHCHPNKYNKKNK